MTIFSEIDEEHRREDGCMFNAGRYDEPLMIEEYDNDVEQWKEILKEDTIKCANCKHELLEVLKVKEDKEINTSIRAVCPYCNDTSFRYTISGKIYIQAANGLSIDSNPVKKKPNGVLFTTITMVKNK